VAGARSDRFRTSILWADLEGKGLVPIAISA